MHALVAESIPLVGLMLEPIHDHCSEMRLETITVSRNPEAGYVQVRRCGHAASQNQMSIALAVENHSIVGMIRSLRAEFSWHSATESADS